MADEDLEQDAPTNPDDALDEELRKMQASEKDASEEEEEDQADAEAEEDGGEAGKDGQGEAEEDAQGQQPDSVPLAVALEWKRDAKALNREVSELKSQLGELLKTVKAGDNKEEPEPNFEDSPVEYLAHQTRKQSQMISDLRQALDDQTARNQVQTVQSEIKAIEQSFATKTPDYWQAAQYLADTRIKELQEVFGYNEDEAAKRFSEDTARFINSATARGKSFAEEAYSMAKKLGYKAAAPAAANSNGAGKPAVGESLKDTARKLAAARSLGSAAGKTPKEELSPEDALELSDEDFDKQFVGEEGTRRMRALFGD